MLRRLLCLSIVALVLAPVASADGGGPSPGVNQGWDGVTTSGIKVRYVTVPSGTDTVLEAIRKSDGRVVNFLQLTGEWGIPAVTNDGQTGGLSTDGSTLVLAEATSINAVLGSQSSFLVIDTKHWGIRQTVILHGDFSYDALSPRAHTLYLIQHVSGNDLSRYVVRAYNLDTGSLLPGRIADRTQRGWVMTGYAITRTTSADSRWVYTLYRNDGGYPFVHALDTVNRKAHCIGVPWTGAQDNLVYLRLSLPDSGRRLLIDWQDGTPVASIDTHTYRLVRATAGSGDGSFPWWAVVAPIVGLGAAVLVRMRLRRSKPAEVLPA